MSDVVTDTHALIWYLSDSPRLSVAANRLFERCDRGEIIIYVPTICLVEIIYFQEKGRILFQLKTQLDRELMHGNTGMIVYELTVCCSSPPLVAFCLSCIFSIINSVSGRFYDRQLSRHDLSGGGDPPGREYPSPQSLGSIVPLRVGRVRE